MKFNVFYAVRRLLAGEVRLNATTSLLQHRCSIRGSGFLPAQL